jgi:hypothetical protein
VKLPPSNDPIAILLRDHFQTEESDAGLRSPSLEGSQQGSSSPDAAFVARVDSGRHDKHVRCRAALAKLSAEERLVLTLAYGLHLRSREIDDASNRRAPRKDERNWRVVLRETYRLGDIVGIVFLNHRIDYLLSDAGKNRSDRIASDAVIAFMSARQAFAAVYETPNGEARLDEPKRRSRGRPKAADGIRHVAFGGIHGREIVFERTVGR